MKYGITTIAVILVGLGLGSEAKAQGISDVQLVQSWYARYLHREPDRCGLESWVRQLRTGSPPECVEAAILSSDEYYDLHERCPRGFVRGLYADVLAARLPWLKSIAGVSPFARSASQGCGEGISCCRCAA